MLHLTLVQQATTPKTQVLLSVLIAKTGIMLKMQEQQAAIIALRDLIVLQAKEFTAQQVRLTLQKKEVRNAMHVLRHQQISGEPMLHQQVGQNVNIV